MIDERPIVRMLGWALVLSASAGTAAAAAPTAADALKLSPMQRGDVNYDRPDTADAVVRCTIKAEKINGHTGWVVRDSNAQVLREFVDTNADNVVDRWGYFKDGVEAYRDIDSNFNGKADQYRWLNTAGTRWGFDKDEDGKIDSWKMISAEEVSSEVVAALRDKDTLRFSRLLLSASEVSSLGLGSEKTKDLQAKVKTAAADFAEIARTQKTLTADTEWVNFGGALPGVVPAGTDGSTSDLVAYENVVAMVETAGKHGQVQIGTLVRLGDTWRVIDVPELQQGAEAKVAASGFFFQTAARSSETGEAGEGSANGAVQKLMVDLGKLDAAIAATDIPAQLNKLNDQRVELIERMAEEAGGKDRDQWLHTLADSVGQAVQGGTYPGGVAQLKTLYEKLEKDKADADLAAYVKFRYLTAEYGQSVQAENPDYVTIQANWQKNLEQFVTDYPASSDAAEAMLQLAIAQEFAGQEEKAKKWYREILDKFPNAASAKKAQGAATRLDSVGKSIDLRGKSTRGDNIDLAKLRGKVVVIHYWATWCEPCKTDMAQLKELQAKYGRSGFALIGINLDEQVKLALDYLQKSPLPWPQLYEPGGLDSRLANELGILTLPTMLLIDDKGLVINRSLHITELDGELRKILKVK